MSGLEAFGLACNVIAVISFGLETIKLCRSINKTRSADPELVKNAQRTAESSKLLLTPRQLPALEVEQLLYDMADECFQCAKDIEQEVDYISPKKNGFFAAMKSTMKTMRRKKRLDQLKDRFEASRNTLDTAVIAKILQDCAASGELNRDNFDEIIERQKTLNMAHQEWYQGFKITLEQFEYRLKNEFIDTHELIVDESMKTRKFITAGFDAVENNKYQDQAYGKLLQSLKYSLMNQRKNNIQRKHGNTLDWIFQSLDAEQFSPGDFKSKISGEGEKTSDSNELELWRQRKRLGYVESAKNAQEHADLLGWLQKDASGPYWISGKAGSGKSTLMKFIITDDRTKTALKKWRCEPEIISHFLWKAGSNILQHSFKGLLCSLLHQILSIDIDYGVQLLKKTPSLKNKNDESDWDIEELKDNIFEVIQLKPSCLLILLDGLDELVEPHGGMDEVFAFLDNLMGKDRVKLCISSRPEQAFRQRFSSYQSLRMQDLNYEDILNYTVASLQKIGLKPGDTMQESIVSEILWKADGVFIWVYTVLKSVERGVRSLQESWDDIYDRIRTLPADLMELYQDMWSRLGDDRERYARQAALFFQILRFDEFTFGSLACVAVASDDTIIERFDGRDELPSPRTLAKRCEQVHRTLESICFGLLETTSSFQDLFPQMSGSEGSGYFDDQSLHHAIGVWDSEIVRVDFFHRTAIDFLDSDEGEKLFGKHKMSQESIFSRNIKAAVILGCTPYLRDHNEYCGKWRIVEGLDWRHSDPYVSDSQLSDRRHELFCLCYRYAGKIDDFSRPPETFSSQSFFVAVTASAGLNFLESIARVVSLDRRDGSAIAKAALLGVCNQIVPMNDEEEARQKYGFLQNCLQKCARPENNQSKSTPLDASDHIVIAWRCFLVHSLYVKFGSSRMIDEHMTAVIESFIAAGVMTEAPGQRYLIKVRNGWNAITIPSCWSTVENLSTYRFGNKYQSIVLEVNDNFLLQQMCSRISTTSDVILQAKKDSFVRPVLAHNAEAMGRDIDMFTCALKEDVDEEDFAKEAISAFGTGNFPDGTHPYLEVEHVGVFRHIFQALDKIGYDVPDANQQQYICWDLSWYT